MQENLSKNVWFLGNVIWIKCDKFSLLRREYLPSAANVLTNSPKISGITKREIFQLRFLKVSDKCDKSAVRQISAVFGIL